MSDYKDRWITCTDHELRIRGYYFPWGTKRVPYGLIRSWKRFPLSWSTGKARIWGSGDFRHWANLDPQRPRKTSGFSLDLGRRITPVVTPEDPETFEKVLRAHTGISTEDQ